MAEAQRFVIALVASVLFLSSLPFISAETNVETDLILEISESEILSTYYEGQIVSIESRIVNNGDANIFQENPSCNVFMSVLDENNITVYSNSELCRNQSRDFRIGNNESKSQTPQEWNFKGGDGDFVDSGRYKIEIRHSKINLKDSTYVNFIKKPLVDKNIELHVIINNLETISSKETYVAQVLLKNIGLDTINLTSSECLILVSNFALIDKIKSCFFETELLHPNENIYAGHVLIDEENYDFSTPITFELYGSERKYDLNLENNRTAPNNSGTDFYSEYDNWNGSSIRRLIHEDRVEIFAVFDDQRNHNFDSTCNASITIFTDYGDVHMSEDFNPCLNKITTSSNGDLNIFEWKLVDERQCYISMGKYTVFLQIGSVMFSFEYNQNKKNLDAECLSNIHQINFQSTVTQSSLYSSIQIDSPDKILRIESECLAVVKISSSINPIYTENFCGFKPGNFFTLKNNSLNFHSQMPLELLNPSGRIDVKLSSLFGQPQTYFKTITLNNQNTAEIIKIEQLDGIWENIQYGNNECWLLSSPNSATMIDAAKLTSQWRPKEGWSGTYKTTVDNRVSQECGIFGIPLVIIEEVYRESEPIVNNEPTSFEEQKSNEIDVVTITVTGTASASILVTLVLLISNTESMRIPVTSAGLWMLALVGKTHETSDGRFQRGRLIGYLTANPGCHFRALMAALNMSNGQITHHLRLLENQELIWRINDGRFVRYYPLNNSLYPGMNPDDLPVPPLSPDPKSLQGKILTLLDDEHQIGEFPTQSELAKKLEKSQQLISHHLRTLQKYGLVEKRKMGIKNRYKLTKEALFLLETDMDYNKIRD